MTKATEDILLMTFNRRIDKCYLQYFAHDAIFVAFPANLQGSEVVHYALFICIIIFVKNEQGCKQSGTGLLQAYALISIVGPNRRPELCSQRVFD